MKIVKMKCPNCGAELLVDKDEKWAVCEHCSEKFYLDDEKKPAPFININFWGNREKKSNDVNPAAMAVGIILTTVLIFTLTFGGIIINYLIDGNNPGTTEYTYRDKPESAVMRSFVH